MYCEKCCRIIEEKERCPICKGRSIRFPEAKDPCFLTEQNYINSSILEDVLNQNGIPFLKKGSLGAGLAVRVGPVLEWNKFYVAYDVLDRAQELTDELFSESDATGTDEDQEAEEQESAGSDNSY